MMKRRRGWFSALVGAGLLGLVWFAQMATSPPSSLTLGRLTPCPDSPNCVCSQDDRPSHYVEPLRFSGDPDAAFARLAGTVRQEPRATIVQEGPGYLRAEFRSRVFRFVDDVEFLLNPTGHTIEVRSASRVGYSDLGVNRRRVERLRARFDDGLANGERLTVH